MTHVSRDEAARRTLAAIIADSDDAVIARDLEGRIISWNRGAERLFGYSATGALGQNIRIIIPPERQEEEERILATISRGEQITNYESQRLTRHGRLIEVSMTDSPIRDRAGRIVGFLKIARDITLQKQAEDALRQSEEVLTRSKEELERLVQERTGKLREAISEMERMSYSMVHDLRAPLRAMQSFAGILETECGASLPPRVLDYLHRISEASTRLDHLVTDALNYNKIVRQNPALSPVDLGPLLRGIVQTYPDLWPSASDVTIKFPELFVLGNESLLTQCFANLLRNAAKFVAPGVRPCIRVWARSSTLNHQPSTIINVEDNGIGIPQDAQESVFHMFQRLHSESEYPGTGIGLAIVRKAVERMGGRVGLESSPGQGSNFWIELPKAVEGRNQERLAAAA